MNPIGVGTHRTKDDGLSHMEGAVDLAESSILLVKRGGEYVDLPDVVQRQLVATHLELHRVGNERASKVEDIIVVGCREQQELCAFGKFPLKGERVRGEDGWNWWIYKFSNAVNIIQAFDE